MLIRYFALLLIWPMLCSAKEPIFPVERVIDNTLLIRCNIAEIKAFKLFKIGQAALYLPDCKASKLNLKHSEKLLSFRYQRDIPGHAFSKSALATLQTNLSAEQLKHWETDILRFNHAYQSVKKGDRYDISYTLNNGLQLHLNNKLLASHSNEVFAMHYFTIWLGNKPFSYSLKYKLLNQ